MTLDRIDEATEWLFNETHDLTSSAAADIVNLAVNDGFWAFATTIVGGCACVSPLFSYGFSLERKGPGSRLTLAYASLIYSLEADILAGFRYLGSLAAPRLDPRTKRPLGVMIPAVGAATMGLWGLVNGALGLDGGMAGLAGGVGIGAGVAVLWVGYEDVQTVSAEWNGA